MKLMIAISMIVMMTLIGVFFWSRVLSHQKPQHDLSIMTSFYPLLAIAKEMTEGIAQVDMVTPAGSEPHEYELTPTDLVRLHKSTLVIIMGNQFEPWANTYRMESNAMSDNILAMIDEIDTTKQLSHKQIIDPHIWLDPILSQNMVRIIQQRLSQIDPTHDDIYQSRATMMISTLSHLDDMYRSGLSHCKQTSFVTSHEAFSYLASRYHLTQIAVTGLSPEEEPSPTKMAEITNLIHEKSISYIFVEPMANQKISQTIAQETGATVLVLDPLEQLSHDQGEGFHAYTQRMEQNLSNLRTALACT